MAWMAFDDQGLEVLDDEECRRLLADGWLGRIGLTIGGVPAIFPVNYMFEGGAVWFRTGAGVKLEAARRGDTMAFEVDGVDRCYQEGWSVLAVGGSALVAGDGNAPHVRARPWAPGPREHLVRISVDFVSGRRIVHRAASGTDDRRA
jgi:nitroimidazol reductase NimA-like FMN-containing flavoprotein (pyridoxamine 5'-phosphate oxidase superfamily)